MKKKILIGVVIVSLIVLFRVLGFDQYLNTTYLLEQREQLLTLVGDNFILTAVIFIGIYVVATAFSIPGAAVLSLAGGLLFGLGFGLIFVNIGASLGATINFIFARYIIGDSIQKKYGDKFEKFNNDIEKNGKNYLLTMRLIPLFPFFLVNVMAGVSSVKMRTFVWTTVIGIIPGSIFYVYAGTTLKNADALTDFISWKTTLPLVILGLLAFLPVIINKFRKSSDEL